MNPRVIGIVLVLLAWSSATWSQHSMAAPYNLKDALKVNEILMKIAFNKMIAGRARGGSNADLVRMLMLPDGKSSLHARRIADQRRFL